MDLSLFNLPLLWLSPLAGAGSCSHPSAAVPAPQLGQRPSLSLAVAPAGTAAVVATGIARSAQNGWSVPPAKAAPGWKPLMLLVRREGQACAVASPGARGTRSTARLQRACVGWPAGRGRLMALANFGLSEAEAQSHIWVRFCVGVGWAMSHQTAATALANRLTWRPLPQQGWFWLDCSGVQSFV